MGLGPLLRQAFFALPWLPWGLAPAPARHSKQDKEALHDPGQDPWCSALGKEALGEQRDRPHSARLRAKRPCTSRER